MSRILIKILAAVIALGLLLVIAVGASLYYVSRHPEGVKRFLETELRERLGGDAAIGKLSIDYPGLVQFTFDDLSVTGPEPVDVSLEHLVLRVSPWRFFLGRPGAVSIRIEDSRADLPFDEFVAFMLEETVYIPDIDIRGLSLRLVDDAYHLDFNDVGGHIDEDELNLTMKALGGAARVNAWHVFDAWKGSVTLQDARLDQVSNRAAGSSNIYLVFDVGGGRTGVIFKGTGHDILLPWCGRRIDDVLVLFDMNERGGTLAIDTIALKTPLIEIRGSGAITEPDDPENGDEGYLSVDLESSEFEYEPVVELIPTDLFPAWLDLLLTKQIRDGTTRFASIRYRGKVGDLTRGETYYHNLSIEQELHGQSFGSGFSLERIRDVTGTGSFSNGTIAFRNLSGWMGGSQVQQIDFAFVDIHKDVMTITVDVDVDMALGDYVDTWRAAMTEQFLHDILAPVGDVANGRIRAQYHVVSPTPSDEPTRVKGEITLSGCAFSLEGVAIRGLDATLKKPELADPLTVESSGYVNDIPLDYLKLVFDDFLVSDSYRFHLKTARFYPLEHFRFIDNTVLEMEGAGDGSDIEASVRLSMGGIELNGIPYEPVQGVIDGTGTVRASLWPEVTVDIPDMNFTMYPGDISVTAVLTESEGKAYIDGVLDLARVKTRLLLGSEKTMQGLVEGDFTATWNDRVTLTGDMTCNDVSVIYKETPLTINGALRMAGDSVSTEELSVGYGEMDLVAAGTLALAKPMHFAGSLYIDDIILKAGEAQALELPGDFTAEADLTVNRISLYGFPVEEATARMTLENETLRFDDAVMRVPSGSAAGSLFLAEGQSPEIDLTIFIQNANIKDFLQAFSPDTTTIDGLMNCEGHIQGKADSLNGTLKFKAKNGRIMKYSVISKIFSVLNVYKIYRTGELDLLNQGFPYTRITSTFDIKDGIIGFDDFYFDSNSLQMSALGSYSMKKKTIDAVVGVKPLETLDRTINLIPLVGRIITGADGRLLVVYLKMTGDFDNPEVAPAPVATISKPLVGIINRALEVPIDILTDPLKLIPGREYIEPLFNRKQEE
ncbi:MAG: AsmA-like C-terminal domain-containing protein [Deltaproteobacteria bacterium]|nr:AsmA-like C-terminal domain-containing protein [Deltaproteobacteria bacterium]